MQHPWFKRSTRAYIGSHGAMTAHLEQLIEATLDGGRAVVAAIERTLPKVA